MKKFLHVFLFAFIMFAAFGSVNAQCSPDTSVGVGIFPEIPDTGCVGQPYNDVVTFVFPPDTVYGGFLVPFDSFVVGTVVNIPPGLQYQCDQFANNCTYYTNPPNLTRGCVEISGTPTAANTANDSVIVVGAAWITVFGFPVSLEDSIKISLRVFDSADPYCGGVAVDQRMNDRSLDLRVYPNPLEDNSMINFQLDNPAYVNLSIQDLTGRTVNQIANGQMTAGPKEFNLQHDAANLQSGIYFIRLEVDDYVMTRKVIVTQ